MLYTFKNLFGGDKRSRPARKVRHAYQPEVEAFEERLVPSAAGHLTTGVAPSAPSFTATPSAATQVKLSWNTVAGASGYLVDEWSNGAWAQIGSVGSASTSDTITGLNPGTTYYFDVASYNTAGTTWANFRSVTTPVAPPSAPSFTARAFSATQVNLSWNSVTGASGYLVDEWINGAWVQIASLNSGSTSDAITGLSAATTYYFDVAANNAAGTTWANFQSVTTGVVVDHPTAATAYSPVTGSLFGANGPSYLDVQQGAVGDCWLLASLAEVAARDPQDIRNMFTADGTTVENGTVVTLYTVRLYNNAGVAKYFTVDTELPSGGGQYDHPANGVLWVALAEKAYAEANGASLVTTGTEGSDSYSALSGGDPAWALQAITGKAASDYSINPNNIAAAWNAGQLIVLISSSNPTSSYIVGSPSEGTHAYAVVGYNPSSSMPFQVYNPWGTNAAGWALGTFDGHQVYGLFTANGAFLSQNFSWQTFGAGVQSGSNDHAQALTDLIFSLAQQAQRSSDASAAVLASLAQAGATGGSSATHALDALWAQAATTGWTV